MQRCTRLLWLTRWPVLAVLAIGVSSAAAEAGVHKVAVFRSGNEGYNIYRIPTIVRAANGDLLAFAEARSGGDASHIDIVMKRSVDAGKSWGTLQVVKDNADFEVYFDPNNLPQVTVGNQSPVVDLADPEHPGRIWMPFTLENDRVFVTYSDNHGQTWSDHVEITADVKDPSWGWYATGPVHGIQLTRGEHAGRLIIPSDHRIAGVSSWGAHVVYSDDHGQTWQLGAVDTHAGSDPVHPNENAAVQLVDGRVYFNARNQGGSNVTRSEAYSSDGGTSYDERFVLDDQFTTPVVQNSVLRFRAVDQSDDENLLIHSGPGQANSRRDMTIRLSRDESATWTAGTKIHDGPSAYSDLVKLSDEQVGILYEAGESLYDEILFGYFAVDQLDPAPFNGVEGDVNQDGAFNAQDIDAFVAAWAPGAGEYFLGGSDSYAHGDVNFDGRLDVHDAILFRQLVVAEQLPSLRLADLVQQVPEPSVGRLAVLALLFWQATPDRSTRSKPVIQATHKP